MYNTNKPNICCNKNCSNCYNECNQFHQLNSNITTNPVPDYKDNCEDLQHDNFDNSNTDFVTEHPIHTDKIKLHSVYTEYCNKIPEIVISDEYLLTYMLKKYKVDKQKLISMLKNLKEKEIKTDVIKEFYKRNPEVLKKQLSEQFKIFKIWNDSGFPIFKDQLECYLTDNFNDL